jgi:hypothetical protein
MLEGSTPGEVYGEEILQIQRTLGRIYGFTMSLSDDGREAFVKEELGRLSVVQ